GKGVCPRQDQCRRGRGDLPAHLAAHLRRAVRRSTHGARYVGRVYVPNARSSFAQLPDLQRPSRCGLPRRSCKRTMSLFSNRAQVLFSKRAQVLGLFADILDYPAPGLARKAAECAALIGAAQPEAAVLLENFCRFAEEKSVGKLQEVYSGFFDLNSICHPYVGYQLFGENYKRSIFLIGLKKAYPAEAFAPTPT